MRTAALVAARNAELHLMECLRSLEDFDDVHIVNDDSDDETAAIARAAGHKCKHWRKHRGQTAAKLELLRMAKKADLVCFVDSDDYRIPGTLRSQVEALGDADVVSSPVIRTSNRTPLDSPANPWLFAWNGTSAALAMLWRRSALLEIAERYRFEEGAPEPQFALAFLRGGRRFAWSSEVVGHYRDDWSPDQASKVADPIMRNVRRGLKAIAPPEQLKLFEIMKFKPQ